MPATNDDDGARMEELFTARRAPTTPEGPAVTVVTSRGASILLRTRRQTLAYRLAARPVRIIGVVLVLALLAGAGRYADEHLDVTGRHAAAQQADAERRAAQDAADEAQDARRELREQQQREQQQKVVEARAGLDKASTSLSAAVKAGSEVLDGSAKKVADNAVRADLKTVLDEGDALLTDEVDPDDIDALQLAGEERASKATEVGDRTKVVQDARTAWERAEADRIAAEQEKERPQHAPQGPPEQQGQGSGSAVGGGTMPDRIPSGPTTRPPERQQPQAPPAPPVVTRASRTLTVACTGQVIVAFTAGGGGTVQLAVSPGGSSSGRGSASKQVSGTGMFTATASADGSVSLTHSWSGAGSCS